MASEREDAKKAIIARERDDPELADVLTGGHRFQLELARETNRHQEAMRAKDLGSFGWLMGGENTAPFTVALVVVMFGIVAAIGCWVAAWNAPTSAEFWAKQAERGIAVSSAALAFIFGRGSK